MPFYFRRRSVTPLLLAASLSILFGPARVLGMILVGSTLSILAPHIAIAVEPISNFAATVGSGIAVAGGLGGALVLTTAFSALHIMIVGALGFFVPTSVTTAVTAASPTLAAIAPGAIAAASMQYDTDPELSNSEKSARVAGAASVIFLGLRSATWAPRFAAALSAPVSGPWVLATAAACSVGMMAASVAHDTVYGRPNPQ